VILHCRSSLSLGYIPNYVQICSDLGSYSRQTLPRPATVIAMGSVESRWQEKKQQNLHTWCQWRKVVCQDDILSSACQQSVHQCYQSSKDCHLTAYAQFTFTAIHRQEVVDFTDNSVYICIVQSHLAIRDARSVLRYDLVFVVPFVSLWTNSLLSIYHLCPYQERRYWGSTGAIAPSGKLCPVGKGTFRRGWLDGRCPKWK